MFPWGKPKVVRNRKLATEVRRSYIERIIAGEELLCGLCYDKIYYPLPDSQRISRGGKGSVSVDHVIRLEDGGSDTVWNMQPAHTKCNQEKG